MSSEPENDFLDTELRNIFHDYDLPPAEHPNVWAGVEARIATLPAPRAALPSQLLLPLAAAVLGVAVGWLLPHPTARLAPAPPLAAPTAAQATLPAPPLSQAAEWVAAATPTRTRAKAMAPAKAQSQPMAKHIATLRAMPTTSAPEAANQTIAQPVVVTDSMGAASSTATAMASATSLAAGADSLPAGALSASTPAKSPLAKPLSVANGPVKVLKPKGSSEKIGYHKPTNRQSGQSRDIRRWFSHLGQSLRHVVGL